MEIDAAQKVRTRRVATLMVVGVVLLEAAALVWVDRTTEPVVSHGPATAAVDGR